MANLSLERLLFDAATGLGAQVGAFVLAKDGTAIENTGTSLNVNVTNGIAVDLTQDDEITVYQGTSPWVVSGDVNISDNGGSITVDATALDIRALTNADVVTAEQGTSPWVISGDVNISDNGGSITVDATALDIRALTNADVVTAEQGTSPWVISGDVNISDNGGSITIDGSVDVDNLEPNVACLQANMAVTDTAALITPLTARRRIQIQNIGGEPVYLGSSTVATTDGLKIEKGATESLECGATLALYLVAPTGKTVNCRILQLS